MLIVLTIDSYCIWPKFRFHLKIYYRFLLKCIEAEEIKISIKIKMQYLECFLFARWLSFAPGTKRKVEMHTLI